METIPIPTMIQLGVHSPKIVPYKSFTPAMEGESTSTAHDAVQRQCKSTGDKIFRFVIPGTRFYDLDKTEMANPKHLIAMFFRVGKNCLQVMGYSSGTEFYVIDNLLYKRVTWAEVGVTGRENGLVAKVNKKTEKSSTYFLKKCEQANEEPLRSAIVSGLEKLVFSK